MIGRSIGEESWDAGERDGLTDEFTWIVDPIDVSVARWCELM